MKNKKLNIFSIVLTMLLALSFTSCETWIDSEINIDPDSPAEVPMSMLFPSIQTNMAYDMGGNDAVRTTGIWMQYFDGVARQSYAEGTFVYTPANCNNLWNDLYGGIMKDINDVIVKASVETETGDILSPYSRGVAEIELAQVMAFTTNLWGDVPYSEAFQGDENLSPKADTQESIYTAIIDLLNQAITDLSATSSVLPIEGDMIFGNDEGDWLATAYALKARYSLLLQKQNGTSAYTDAIAAADLALTNGFAGYEFDNFGEGGTEQNPTYQFMNQRSGDLVMGATFVNILINNNNDPRTSFFAAKDEAGSYSGSVSTSITDGVSLLGTYNASKDSRIVFMNLAELYFIQSEAYLMTGDNTMADSTFKMGTTASVNDVVTTVDDADSDPANFIYGPTDLATWLSNNAAVVNVNLEEVMTQKYVANYATIQGFNDWRRTGYPTLTVPAGAVKSEIPRRYVYPQEEVTYNSNISNEGITILGRVWWDVE